MDKQNNSAFSFCNLSSYPLAGNYSWWLGPLKGRKSSCYFQIYQWGSTLMNKLYYLKCSRTLNQSRSYVQNNQRSDLHCARIQKHFLLPLVKVGKQSREAPVKVRLQGILLQFRRHVLNSERVLTFLKEILLPFYMKPLCSLWDGIVVQHNGFHFLRSKVGKLFIVR